ncbi:1,5-anhydro-D-fructose reductase [Paenibacillus konkukensis]|uniref:1,5-anhydro-D-fructose reductase n=1 Tax=Paenibacillus konkukensis TaxID=2020716 RepID=A0ABY4RXH2_9BACL|nr:Gfo/Idh/MocA family oxidoreductase [Paenibacillus konkukensis]UQZ86122.1 1,5-anhydro-D-fructose reductase [Paenibacillus konkukensis]
MKAAVLGCGIMGKTHARNWPSVPGVRLVGVCDADRPTAEKVAAENGTRAYASLEEMLEAERPDVLSVCLPTYLHKPYVLQAAGAGVHVVCEKPIAPTLEDAEDIIAGCRSHGVRLFIAQVVRFFPSYRDLAAKVRAGAIGEPGVMHTKRIGGHPGQAKAWYYDREKSGGVILDLLIHDIDYMRSVFGEVETVFALNRVTEETDYALVTLRFKQGAIANLEGHWGYPGPFTTAAEFAGTKGVLRFHSDDAVSLRVHAFRKSAEDGPKVAVPKSPAYHDPYYYELEHFAQCIRSGEEPLVTAEDAYRAMEIGHAAIASAKSGQPVRMDEFARGRKGGSLDV